MPLLRVCNHFGGHPLLHPGVQLLFYLYLSTKVFYFLSFCIFLFIKRKDNFIPFSDFSGMALIKANDNLTHFIDMGSPLLTPSK